MCARSMTALSITSVDPPVVFSYRGASWNVFSNASASGRATNLPRLIFIDGSGRY